MVSSASPCGESPTCNNVADNFGQTFHVTQADFLPLLQRTRLCHIQWEHGMLVVLWTSGGLRRQQYGAQKCDGIYLLLQRHSMVGPSSMITSDSGTPAVCSVASRHLKRSSKPNVAAACNEAVDFVSQKKQSSLGDSVLSLVCCPLRRVNFVVVGGLAGASWEVCLFFSRLSLVALPSGLICS